MLAAFGLSGAAGLNAWIPLLAVGLLSRAGQLELADGYDWLASTPALIVLGAAFVLDFVGDKVPAIDSLLHAVGTVVHPAAGAIVFAGPTEVPTDVPSIVLFALGASVAGSLHATRATVRPVSTTMTAGAGNPCSRWRRTSPRPCSASSPCSRRSSGAICLLAVVVRRGAVVAARPKLAAAARFTLSAAPPPCQSAAPAHSCSRCRSPSWRPRSRSPRCAPSRRRRRSSARASSC